MTQEYKAAHLPHLQGVAAWNAMLPEHVSVPELDHGHSCDVAIIGAGFAGLAAARRLQQLDASLDITVLDALALGEGGVGRNSGFMIDLPHDLTSEDYAGAGSALDNVLTRLNRQAIGFAGEAVDDYGIAPHYFEPAGKINGATTAGGDQANRQYAGHLTAMKEPFEVLDAGAMQEITGSRFYTSGIYTPGTVLLQPAGYAQGMARGLMRDGARLFVNSPVLKFAKTTGSWRLTTPKGHVDAHKVILAVNGHLGSFGVQAGKLLHLFLFSSMTCRLDDAQCTRLGGQARWGITPSDPMGTTVRRIQNAESGTRIITRTGVAYCPDTRPTAVQLKRAIPVMRNKFERRFPDLAGVAMAYCWSGHVCLATTGYPSANRWKRGYLQPACKMAWVPHGAP